MESLLLEWKSKQSEKEKEAYSFRIRIHQWEWSGKMRAARIPIPEALEELIRNPSKIGTVDQWAMHMGYSRSYFSTRFHTLFGRCAMEAFNDTKYKLVITIVKKHPHMKSTHIAYQAGFWNDRALRRFLRNAYRINISQLRELCSEENLFLDEMLNMELIFSGEIKNQTN